MAYNFKLPSITGKNADEKVQQLLSYIYKLVGDLNYFANQSADAPKGENTQVGNDANSTNLAVIQKKVRDLQTALNGVKTEIESIPVAPPEVEYLEGVTENIQTQIDAVNEAIAEIEIPTLPELAKVATSGDYNDLKNLPTIPDNIDVDIVKTQDGEQLYITDSAEANLLGYKMYGKSVQDGTPTPEAPIEIESVGDSGSVETKITGANLFDVNATTKGYTVNNSGEISINTNYMVSDYVPVISGEEYTASEDQTYAVSTETTVRCCCYDENKTFISVLYEDSRTEVRTYTRSFVVPSNAKYIRLGYRLTDENIMVSRSRTILHTLTEPLRGIGDVKDEIDFARGVYIQRVYSFVLNGTSVKVAKNDGVADNTNYIYYRALPKTSNTEYAPICTHLQGEKSLTNANRVSWISGYKQLFLNIKAIAQNVGNNEDSVNAWLAENPMTVQYVLAEPIETPLTDEEIAQFRSMHTYESVTNVSTDSIGDIEVEYVKNTDVGKDVVKVVEHYTQQENDVINRLLGTVLYEVDPTTTNGLYCSGSTTADSVNSASLADSTHKYKRLKIFAQFPYGTHIQEFDLATKSQANNATYGDRTGGMLVPTADNTSGANNHYLVKLNFCVKETTSGWTFQVTDSGWVHMGIPAASTTQYATSDVTINGTAYQKWNQRHNYSYCVYKIIGYVE